LSQQFILLIWIAISSLTFQSFSRAHHTEYTPIPVEELIQRHPQIYRSRRASPDDLITHPENEPLVDSVGYEVKFFDQRGRRIRRRVEDVDLDDPLNICGILLNLPTVEEIFTLSPDTPYHNSDVFISKPTVNKYSMAFIRDAGQIQSHQPFPLLTTPLKEVNEFIALREESSDHFHTLDDDGNVIDSPGLALPAIFNVSFQIYNRMLHFIAPRANEYEAILGHVTAALGGRWANTPTDKAQAQRASAKIQRRFPHERLRLASSSGHASKDLRVEPVYVIDMNKIHPDHRNGRCVLSLTGIIMVLQLMTQILLETRHSPIDWYMEGWQLSQAAHPTSCHLQTNSLSSSVLMDDVWCRMLHRNSGQKLSCPVGDRWR
jgi:hypothetical protein